MIHYNVNTAQFREWRREEFDPARIEAVRPLLTDGTHVIPEHPDFSIRLHLRGGNAIYTCYRFGVTPLLASALVTEATDEAKIWHGIVKLIPSGSGFHRLDPLMPDRRPWVASALLPKHIFVSEGIEWITGYCLCIAWALADTKSK
jgi:hypothetical protein